MLFLFIFYLGTLNSLSVKIMRNCKIPNKTFISNTNKHLLDIIKLYRNYL